MRLYSVRVIESRLYVNWGLMHHVCNHEFTERNGYAMARSSA